jgi:uncharacterized protein DUF3631
MWTCLFQHGENFVSNIERLSRDEIRRRIGLVPADNQHSRAPNYYENGAVLLNEVHAFVGKFVAYPSAAAHDAHVLWLAHTHCMPAWESTPRIAFLSPEPASGKTRALELSELLVPNAVEAVNVSPAYLFRKVGDDEAKPTILYDEIDTVFGPKAQENEEIRGLLNAGHRRGAVAGRCVVHGKVVTTEEISAYCAVALAGLGWLPDTILTRAIVIRMRRRAPTEKITAFRRRVHAPEGHALRDSLAAWSVGAVAALEAARPDLPAGIEDRNADVWEPLLAIADAIGGDWPKRARDAAVALVGAATDAEPSLGIRLLADLKTVFGDRDHMPTATILEALIALPESPWGDLKGKPISDRILARRLWPYGVKPKGIRIGESTPRGYLRADLYDAWLRYLPPRDAAEAQQAQQAQPTPENKAFWQEDVADVADSKRNTPDKRNRENSIKSNNVADVADVADVRGNGGGGASADDAFPPFPDDLRRCFHCGGNSGVNTVALPDRAIWLHRECEAAWMEKNQ